MQRLRVNLRSGRRRSEARNRPGYALRGAACRLALSPLRGAEREVPSDGGV